MGTEHPANKMADVGIELLNLSIYHQNPSWLEKILISIEARDLVEVFSPPNGGKSFIEVQFRTPNGIRKLSSLSPDFLKY